MDEEEIFILQETYLASRADKDLYLLRQALEPICKSKVLGFCYSHHFTLKEDRIDEIVVDAVGTLMGRYLKHPGWCVRKSFSQVCRLAVKFLLFDKKLNREEMHEASVDIDNLPLECKEDEVEDTFEWAGHSAFECMLHDEPYGNQILIDLYFAHTREEALLIVSTYKGERWVRDNVKLLLYLYKRLRRPKGGKEWLLRIVQSGK
jgi:hypothetical protein